MFGLGDAAQSKAVSAVTGMGQIGYPASIVSGTSNATAAQLNAQRDNCRIQSLNDSGDDGVNALIVGAGVAIGGGALWKHRQKIYSGLFGGTKGATKIPSTVGNLKGGPLEHATQVSGRFNLENGPANGTVFRADNQGNITSYATYDANGQILMRVDVTGAAHNGIPTPHVVEYGRNTLPDGTVRVHIPRTDPRPATPDELP